MENERMKTFSKRQNQSDHQPSLLFIKLRQCRPFLKSRLRRIKDRYEYGDEVEDINFFLSVMSDMQAEETHGAEALQGFINRIHEMIMKISIEGDEGYEDEEEEDESDPEDDANNDISSQAEEGEKEDFGCDYGRSKGQRLEKEEFGLNRNQQGQWNFSDAFERRPTPTPETTRNFQSNGIHSEWNEFNNGSWNWQAQPQPQAYEEEQNNWHYQPQTYGEQQSRRYQSNDDYEPDLSSTAVPADHPTFDNMPPSQQSEARARWIPSPSPASAPVKNLNFSAFSQDQMSEMFKRKAQEHFNRRGKKRPKFCSPQARGFIRPNQSTAPPSETLKYSPSNKGSSPRGRVPGSGMSRVQELRKQFEKDLYPPSRGVWNSNKNPQDESKGGEIDFSQGATDVSKSRNNTNTNDDNESTTSRGRKSNSKKQPNAKNGKNKASSPGKNKNEASSPRKKGSKKDEQPGTSRDNRGRKTFGSVIDALRAKVREKWQKTVGKDVGLDKVDEALKAIGIPLGDGEMELATPNNGIAMSELESGGPGPGPNQSRMRRTSGRPPKSKEGSATRARAMGKSTSDQQRRQKRTSTKQAPVTRAAAKKKRESQDRPQVLQGLLRLGDDGVKIKTELPIVKEEPMDQEYEDLEYVTPSPSFNLLESVEQTIVVGEPEDAINTTVKFEPWVKEEPMSPIDLCPNSEFINGPIKLEPIVKEEPSDVNNHGQESVQDEDLSISRVDEMQEDPPAVEYQDHDNEEQAEVQIDEFPLDIVKDEPMTNDDDDVDFDSTPMPVISSVFSCAQEVSVPENLECQK